MRWIAAVAAATLAATGAAAQTQATDPAIKQALDRDIPLLLRQHPIPSVSLSVVKAGRIAHVSAYGEQSPGVRASPHTLYNIASLTKPITAETILRLAARKRLSLDEPMHRHWVDPDIAGDPRHEQLTPRLSLSHRTGFPNWRRQTEGKLTFLRDPGTAYGYSGEGFEYVATFAERKLGRSFETLAEQAVLRPIGMGSTSYTARSWFDGRVAQPFDKGAFISPSIPSRWIASDDIHSTPTDYARFLIAAMHGSGLTRALAQERGSILIDRTADLCGPEKQAACPNRAGFGLGWEVLQFGGDTILMHTGSDAGTFTFAYFSPTGREGAAVFTNSGEGWRTVIPVLTAAGANAAFLRFLRSRAE